MGLKVTYEHPDFPKGYQFDLGPGIGVVENGKSKELSEDDEITYVTSHGYTVRDGLKGDAVKVEGTASVTKADQYLPKDVSDTIVTAKKDGEANPGQIASLDPMTGKAIVPDEETPVEAAPVVPTATTTTGGDS